jgi:hypothetical protein
MNTKFIKNAAFVLALGAISMSCEKEAVPVPPPIDPYAAWTKIGEAPATGSATKVSLYMAEAPFMGYNNVFAVVRDSVTGQVLSDKKVTLEALMDMGTMVHGTPLEQPVWKSDLMAHQGSVTFIMPTTGGTWEVKVKVENQDGTAAGSAAFPVTVINKTQPKLFSFISLTNNEKLFVALENPLKPKVGLNDFDLVIYKRQSGMVYPAVEGLQVEIEPEMPTMGHGSPNNQNPVSVGNGHYDGVVNFTMTGYWKVNITVKDAQGNVMFADGYFDITFQ